LIHLLREIVHRLPFTLLIAIGGLLKIEDSKRIRDFQLPNVSEYVIVTFVKIFGNSKGSGDSNTIDDFYMRGKRISHGDLLSGRFEIDKKPQNLRMWTPLKIVHWARFALLIQVRGQLKIEPAKFFRTIKKFNAS
jgi:hypothetical protein